MVAAARDVVFVWEQPASSIMNLHPRFAELCGIFRARTEIYDSFLFLRWNKSTLQVYRVFFWMGDWGGTSAKPTYLWWRS